MKNKYVLFLAALMLFGSCKKNDPVTDLTIKPHEDTIPTPDPEPEPDPEGTIYFTATNDQIANPERGMYIQQYYESNKLDTALALKTVNEGRMLSQITLFLHSYYLTDYMESDIAPEFLERLDKNMNTLREGGAKVVLRFSYKHNESINAKPWDATPEWANKHIDQLAPYLKKHADVIYCVQAGFIGVWGEWYYTTSYPQNPYKDAGYETRWPVAEHLMEVVPADRQICFRQPQFKIRYLRTHDLAVTPLTAAEAYQETIKARWAGHNDCFVSSESDVGTYHSDEERAFWAEDSKYTVMGGETCKQCDYSNGANAVKQMEKYHWSYLCNSYHPDVLGEWTMDNHMDEIKRRLGYRFVLDKAYLTQAPKAGEKFEVQIGMHNEGFAAPVNKRNVELIFVSGEDASKKYVYKQTEDPRFWMGGEKQKFTLSCTLDAEMKGEYKLYLNLPDPYPSLHDDPRYSIRLANEKVWDEETGYNFLTLVNIE
ncbi:MAG: DUF4832 domain-containing protein [Paludibacteraceae bacterium]|nr:DUF4832 domain-containing protein [Paludibacteraceae bacterium]